MDFNMDFPVMQAPGDTSWADIAKISFILQFI